MLQLPVGNSMPKAFWRGAALATLVALALLAATATTPLHAQGQAAPANPFCVTTSGHAWQIRRFVTSHVTLYSLEGQRLASVSRNDLTSVQSVVQCDNTTSYVKMDTRFGPRLATRASLVLGGGFGPACACPGHSSQQVASNNQVSASSMGASDRPICNADLPCQ
jgi:hypothetical protein